ncbi:SDR family NAD(P)-dependent oxidoreductase [Pacificoceanicola onchidii]|uniref:SDR family NAD(P)-dependent oxidoreductase n=1 Tax=Pacificoceanicola onchidii TaxID=2562685 RepID=UPI0010A5D92A|nr:SDR family oxidoreductase [Pacificoceanicola onchidii]
MSQPLKGKVAIVAGATGGIGVATVERLVADGATVVASGRNETRLNALRAIGDQVFIRKSDVSIEAEARDLVDWTEQAFGRVDILFNGAGIVGESNLIEHQSLENFERVMSINVTGSFLMMKYAIPAMRRNGGGAIVNVSSAAGVQGGRATMPVYCASKHAVIGLTRVGAKAHAGEGIRINVIVPGQIDTDMLAAVEADASDGDPVEARNKVISAIPAGRYGDTSEVAALTAFLCRDDAKFINGSIYSIDGGFTPF